MHVASYLPTRLLYFIDTNLSLRKCALFGITIKLSGTTQITLSVFVFTIKFLLIIFLSILVFLEPQTDLSSVLGGTIKYQHKYKEGNNRPPRKPLVHEHKKAGNKCHTRNNTNNRKKPKCVNRCPGSVNSTRCGYVPNVESRV